MKKEINVLPKILVLVMEGGFGGPVPTVKWTLMLRLTQELARVTIALIVLVTEYVTGIILKPYNLR